MKILQVIPYFHWSYGGPVKVVYEISKELAKRGHEVAIYTTDVGRGQPLKDSEKIGIDGVSIQYFKCTSNWFADKFKLHISSEMHLAIRDNLKDFDVVHLQECRGIPNAYTHYYAREFNKNYIFQAHGSAPLLFKGQDFQTILFKILFDRTIGKKIVMNASKAIATTDLEAKQYLDLGLDFNSIEVIPNGINLDEFNQLPLRGSFKRKYGIPLYKKIVLYLGRLHKIKGIDLLIDAYSSLAKGNESVLLVLAGPDDGYLPNIKRKIRDLNLDGKVLLTGPLYGRDKLEVFVDADILVYPSIYEVFGIVPLEALMCGTPVIIGNNCGCKYIVEKTQCGFIVDRNPSFLADKINCLLNDKNARLLMAERGRSYIINNLGWNSVTTKLEKLYEQLKN